MAQLDRAAAGPAPATPSTDASVAASAVASLPGFEPRPDAWLDHDRLDAYRVSLEFQQLAARLCRGRGLGALRDQLDRASVSVCLNIAEGAGRSFSRPRSRTSSRSLAGRPTESGAALDLLLARGLVSPADHRRARALLIRIVSMLAGLMRRFGRPEGEGK